MLDDALLPLLPSLVALVEEGGVTRAARRMGVSQPRMSARLAELRLRLGDPVLVSVSRRRGLTPTERGLSMARAVKAGLSTLEAALVTGEFEPSTATRIFRILADESSTAIVGAPLLRAIRAQGAAGVQVAFFAFERAKLGEVESGRFDLVLARPHQIERMPGLRSRIVCRDDFSTIMRAQDGLASIDLDTFCAREHVLISSYPDRLHGKVDEALERVGRRRTIAASVQSHLLAVELVSSTDLIATLPRTLALEGGERVAAFPPPLAFDPFVVCAGWHDRMAGDPAHLWMQSLLPGPRDLIGDTGDQGRGTQPPSTAAKRSA